MNLSRAEGQNLSSVALVEGTVGRLEVGGSTFHEHQEFEFSHRTQASEMRNLRALKRVRRRTSQSLGDVLQGGSGQVPQQRVDGHHHPRRAEAALGAVDLGDPLLHTGRLEVRWRLLLLGGGSSSSSLAVSPALGGSWSWCCRCPPPWSRQLPGAGRWAADRR